jgi:hypothetical protein
MKNAVFWDVTPYRSCAHRRFVGTYSIVPRKLGQCPLGSPSLFRRATLLHRLCPATCSPISNNASPPLPSPHYWFPTWPTLPPFMSLYSWLLSTGSSVCSHLLTLVPHSRICLPWRWRRYVPPKCLFTQELRGAISQKRHSSWKLQFSKQGPFTKATTWTWNFLENNS